MSGDDLCDLCMTSGVSVDRTTPCGKTIGIECGCDESHEDGTCGDSDCEKCKGKCETCGEELDKDCNGQPRCSVCDGPCPCCDTGPGPSEELEEEEEIADKDSHGLEHPMAGKLPADKDFDELADDPTE